MMWADALFIIAGWAIGNTIFNNFEKHLPWTRRIAKLVCILVVLLTLDILFGRIALACALGAMLLGMVILHAYWFPKHGINGITAEPLEQYYQLIGHKKST